MLSDNFRIRVIENLSGGVIICGVIGIGSAFDINIGTMLLGIPLLCILGILLLIASGLLAMHRKAKLDQAQADLIASDSKNLIRKVGKDE